jgi:hypothetical protein
MLTDTIEFCAHAFTLPLLLGVFQVVQELWAFTKTNNRMGERANKQQTIKAAKTKGDL